MADLTNYLMWIYQKEEYQADKKTKDWNEGQNSYKADGKSQAFETEITLMKFHDYITTKNYSLAYDCLTNNFQQQMSYSGWVSGFKTTVSSIVTDIKFASMSPDRAVLTYNLRSEDNPGGIQNFSGTAVLLKTEKGWKIDEIINKKK